MWVLPGRATGQQTLDVHLPPAPEGGGGATWAEVGGAACAQCGTGIQKRLPPPGSLGSQNVQRKGHFFFLFSRTWSVDS